MEHIYFDAYVSVSGHVLQASALAIEDGVEEIVVTKMGNSAPKKRAGLAQQAITATFDQDYDANQVHKILRAAFVASKAGTPVAIVARPDAGAVAADNPQWSGDCKLFKYDPIPNVQVGQKGVVTVRFEPDGEELTYAESA